MRRFTLASCATLLVLVPALVLAQSRPPAGGGGGGGGSSVGTASPRGGEGGGSSAPSSSGSSGGSSGAPSMGSPSGGGSYSSPASSVRSPRNYDGPRSGEAGPVARPRNASSTTVGQAVPISERPRGDRPAVYGQAAPRSARTFDNNRVIVLPGGYYPGYYDPYGYYGYYGYYGGYYGSYAYGYGWPYSYNMWGMPMYGWGSLMYPMSAYDSFWYGYAAMPGYTTAAVGSIKLKVKPKDAEVYVDGTYYGRVDHYNGAFQHLDLPPGTHKVEIRANGYATLQIEMRVLPGKTVTYTGELKAVK